MAFSSFIKHQLPKKNSRYKQGLFDEYNPVKYVGPRPIVYRSSLEYKFMIKLELNPNVMKWSSENFQIPYTLQELNSNGKFVDVRHTYNVDFTVWMKNGNIYVIEVKPFSQSPQNISQIKQNPVMYKNARKWKAAIAWCKQKGYIFKVITEKDLNTSVFK